MTKLDVAYGIPESSGEARLLEALATVTACFDESPKRMHAVLGPAARGVRWFTFACSIFAKDRVLAQEHFVETMDLAELLVVVRSPYGTVPLIARSRELEIVRDERTIHVRRGRLGDGTRRDGDVDEILLDALGLGGAIRPFEALDAPTHEVVLRQDHERPLAPSIVALGGPVLPVRVSPRLESHGPITESFAARPRAADTGDRAALAAHLEALSTRLEREPEHSFDREFRARVEELVRVGPAIGPLLVDFLRAAGKKTRTARVAIAGLASLGLGGEAMIPWAAKSSELPSQAGYAGLVSLGDRARPAIEAARASKKPAERAVGEAVSAMLDSPEWAPVRAARSSPLYRLLGAGESAGWTLDRAFERASPDELWAIAAHVIDVPRVWWARSGLLQRGVRRDAAAFRAVAASMLGYPPFAGDAQLTAIARGEPMPTVQEVRALREKGNGSARPATTKPGAAKVRKARWS